VNLAVTQAFCLIRGAAILSARWRRLKTWFVFGVGSLALKIAQRFNAGFLASKNNQSLQGRPDRVWPAAILSSLKGLNVCVIRISQR